MATQISTLRPGLLVSLKTSVIGNVSYERRDIERDHLTEEGKRKARWETERVVTDPEEHEAALQVQMKAGQLIRRICAKSAFGLLCPESAGQELDEAVASARELIEAFNSTARLTRVRLYVMAGRIAPDDVEAVKAINSEVRDLLADMQEGLANFDVKKIREAAAKAKQLGSMLSPEAEVRIQLAIDAARASATSIVKAGEAAALRVDRAALRKITEARTAFLDLDENASHIQAPVAKGRALDLEPAGA